MADTPLPTKTDRIRLKRDQKVQPHLAQYAPVWLIEETVLPQNDAVQFNVLFYHPSYEWVNRRYRYDAFNDVLYHKGQTIVSEEEALDFEQKQPYITAESINTVNSYGG